VARRVGPAGVVLMAAALAAGVTACGSPRHPAATAARPAAASVGTVPAVHAVAVGRGATARRAATERAARRPSRVRGVAPTLVAHLRGDVAGYTRPGGRPDVTVPGSWYGYPSALPVVARRAGWDEVRLAQRPDGSVTWIRARSARLTSTPWRIVVDLATTHLELYRGSHLVDDFPAGVGTPTDPTVTGRFFLAFYAPPPDPGYGPIVLVTSAHSDAITDWDGSGDAIIAIHGPIDGEADALIGSTGARISHGCIRLHDSDLIRLAGLPAGTPIDIVG
jgi:hypothetical protein